MSSLLITFGLDRLSDAERLQLVEEILASLEQESSSSSLTESQRQELRRRVEALERDPDNVRSWADVKARILARLG